MRLERACDISQRRNGWLHDEPRQVTRWVARFESVGSALERRAYRCEAFGDLIECLAIWNDDLEDAQPCCVGGWEWRATAGPGVEADVVMIASGRDERRANLRHVNHRLES